MGKGKKGTSSEVPGYVLTAINDQMEEVRLQVDTILPAAAAFEIVKILSGANLDRVRDKGPRQVTG